MGDEVSSKKKWILISIVSIVVILLVIGGIWGYKLNKDSQRRDFRTQLNLCYLKCPMISEKVDYEKNEIGGRKANILLNETYEGIEFLYRSNPDCISNCDSVAEERSGISSGRYIDGDQERANELIRGFICATRQYTEEGIENCYIQELNKDYSEESIVSMRQEFN